MHQQRKGALLTHSFLFILPFLFVFLVNNAAGITNLPSSQQIDLTIKCGECLCINSCTQQNPPPSPSPPPPVEQCPPATTNQAPPPPPRFVYFTDPLDHPTLNPPPPPPRNPSNRIPPPPPPRFIYVSEPTTDPYSLDIYSMATITFPERSCFLIAGCWLLIGIMSF